MNDFKTKCFAKISRKRKLNLCFGLLTNLVLVVLSNFGKSANFSIVTKIVL